MSQAEINNQGGQVMVCPECGGTGCKNCGGFGAVLWLQDQVYYWGKKISATRIFADKQKRKVRAMRNSLVFLFCFIGLLALAKMVYDLHSLELLGYDLRAIIWVKNEFSQVFWISILADGYLIYRLAQESKKRHLVRQRKRLYLARKKNVSGNFNWQAINYYPQTDIAPTFAPEASHVLTEAWFLAHDLRHQELEPAHFLASLMFDSQVKLVFARLSLDYKLLAEKAKHALARIINTGKVELKARAIVILLEAYNQAYRSRKYKVSTTDLLYAIVNMEGIVKEIFYEMDVTEKEINHVVRWVDLQKQLVQARRVFRSKSIFKPKSPMNRSYTAVATPLLNSISRDMTLFARAGGYFPLIGREKELGDIFRILETNNLGAVLVGPPGVGKKAIVEGIAELMVAEDVGRAFQDKRLVALSASELLGGATKIGELEGRIMLVLNEIKRSKNIILFIEDIHHLVGASTESGESMDIAEALAEQMQSYNLHVITTTTPDNYIKYIEKSSLARVLQKSIINEPSVDEAIPILEAKALQIEAKEKIYFSYQAIEGAIEWTRRFLHNEYLPEKAIRILEETALVVSDRRGEKTIVTKEDVARVVSEVTNVPVSKVESGESQKLLNLEERMHERVIGQEDAVRMVASALRRARMELRGQNKPIASFLFLGSTGVGKTQVAKTLAEVYFGNEKDMVRVDMSEYQGLDALAKLIGDSRVGNAGYLTSAVENKPYALILLDEIEKAHPDILNVFLQVLDDGRLTDAGGKTIDFTNTIIIGTSNVGTGFIQDRIKAGDKLEVIRQNLIDKYLKESFRPEFINRFDGVVVFHPLEMDHVRQIAKLFLGDLARRVEEKGIILQYEESAVEELARAGFDPTMGARPLRRVIQDRVEDALAKLMLEKQIDRRDKVVLQGDLTVRVEKAERI